MLKRPEDDLTPEQAAAMEATELQEAEFRRRQRGSQRDGNWKATLLTNPKGTPFPQLANAITALRRAPIWQDVLQFDEFALATKVRHSPPWEGGALAPRTWTPRDDSLTADWLQREGIAVATSTAAEAVEVVAKDDTVHPVKDYLHEVALAWDNTTRIHNWMPRYLGAEPSVFTAAAGQNFLISAVARILRPGCKVDTMPIWESPQGFGKSRAAQILAGDWFSDELADLTSKDASLQVAAAWIIEIAELDAMHRAEVTKLKAFLSRRVDRFRPPYGKRVIEVPRQSVFLGTTNADAYLKDESGGRRFWPVKVGTIDHKALEADRDQLWGEAVACFFEGVPWWITNKIIAREAKNEQDKRYVSDPWDEAIGQYLETRSETSVQEILQDMLHLSIADHDQKQQNRVARTLQHLGWLRRQRRVDGKQTYRYFRSAVTTPD